MSDLYQEIAEISKEEKEQITEVKAGETIWLIFLAGEKYYAIDSSLVQEVMRNADCYPLPFVPDYIPGVLNSYGTPYAVVNLDSFLSDSQQVSENNRFYLVLKDKNNVSFQVTDIQEFHNQSEVKFDELNESKDSNFFTGTVSVDDIVAPVVNTEAIIEKVRKDLETR